ncbi:MAG TPA: energy transducer TonB [Candidatus Acidoferrum sp.]|nr:energy transducer TonB [Candidatus Acidoferrum sp.]
MPLSLFPEEVLVPEQTPLLDRRSGVPRVPLQAFRIEHAAAQKVARRPQSNTGVFDETLLDGHRFKSSSKALDLLVAVLIHVIILGGPILAGLYYTDSFNLKEYTKTLLVAPPPPPPPPPPALAGVVRALAVKRVFITAGKLIAPTVIPKQTAELKEAIEPEGLEGVAGGVPGGVPGGQMGGVLGGVIGGVLNTAAKPLVAPTSPGRPGPVRIGGRIRSPKAILRVPPKYPVLARQAHIEGNVQIDAILDEQGNVTQMNVVSGPALLYPAALEALRQWKYEPTYLNDQAISVEMIVTVTFELGQR